MLLVRIRRADLYPVSSLLSCSRTGLSLLGRTLQYISSLLYSSSESESYVTTDGQPASLSWNKAPIWGLRSDFNYFLTVAGLLIWGALSDERTGLSFTIAAVIFGSESRRTRGHILLSQIRDFPLRRLLRLAGSRWRYSTPPPHRSCLFLISSLDLSWLRADRIWNPPCNDTLLRFWGCHPSMSFVAVWTIFT
jgi:hypothetical protein